MYHSNFVESSREGSDKQTHNKILNNNQRRTGSLLLRFGPGNYIFGVPKKKVFTRIKYHYNSGIIKYVAFDVLQFNTNLFFKYLMQTIWVV